MRNCLSQTVKPSFVKKLAKVALTGAPTIGTKKLNETLHSEHGVIEDVDRQEVHDS